MWPAQPFTPPPKKTKNKSPKKQKNQQQKKPQKNKNPQKNKMYVFIFSTTFARTFLIPRTEQDKITNVHRSSCKVPIILSYFNET